MQTTSPYWNEPSFEPLRMHKPITNHLGFTTKIPWPEPVTVGAIYVGAGAMPDRREINTSPFGEYFAVDNTIPSAGGVPLIDINNPIYQYSRANFVHKI
jgi:hypothetical protein